MMNQHQRETEALFSRLHLQDQQQQKLSSSDFLQLSSSVKQQHEVSEKDLPHAFLHRLMMLDYRARYIPVKPDSPEEVHPKLDPMLDTTETDDSDLEAFFTVNTGKHQTETTHVHPMDVQMAVFHCSDNFLKQIMITKLSQCQYALPLLVPDPFTTEIECPLWTFRHLTKSWKVKLKTQMKEDPHIVTMKSIPICKAETPLVLFFRLGSLSVSKSQLMNTLINDRHSTFFHRNCSGSTKNRHLMDGVAEIAWYCPAGKDNDAFSDCIAFCNLHGDALSTEKQRDVLMEKSSVNVVLVPTLQKDDKSRSMISDLLKSQKPLICLVDDSCDAVEIKKGKFKMGLKDKNLSDVSEQLRRVIGEVLSSRDPSSSKPTFQLETMADVSGIRVDESDPVCQRGKLAAMEIVSLLEEMEVSEIKDKFLPCQGHLWHDWCRTKKELYHLKVDAEKERSKKLTKLDQIRKKQLDASCSELMKLFTKSLLSLSSTEKEYFLKWIQILVDALSTDDLSSILQSYDETWSEVLALKNKHDKSHLLSRKQTELEDLSKKLQSATFGLEHIFREMGQIYEAHKTMKSKSSQTGWSKYPELAADLLISGHPMELMDGDAGHVPLIWISSLLDEVIKKLDDQRVFVLSVLGVQSSGKSTMLNAMFGLQFAVSAGRCTKGAFMQLVKVSEEIKKEKDFGFDYILVVDTEGLRALELAGNATLHHDNELATFVVGLGNMTIINIFGENPADMQDILQIVVQAFMRMKKVQLSPSCVFVHQNVTDIAAAEKNMDGKRRLQEKLDQMAQLAAKEETSNADCFSDVIAFDVQKDVKYAAQLWEGSPPMAPPNPGYSESIQELKNIILSKASTSAGITLSQLKTKIKDLWDALLNENFVFSFKNTLEIAVYRKLEVQYGNWTRALRSNMLMKNQCQKETEALFGRLHLQDQQQQKLSSSDFLQLSSSVKQQHEVSEKDLPHAFLHRLMMLDYRARYIPVKPDSPEEVHPKLDPVLDTTETDDSVLEAFLSINTDNHQTKTTHVHPMDVQMAVFHCSDNFLKQIMISKLSQCQYALPLLVPDPFTTEIECPLWTFRHLTKSWKVKLKTQMKEDPHIVTMKSIPICKAETPLVLFFRLGSLSVSKSQLMNTLINDRHSTFFHRNCSGSTKNRHLMDGVAEIAWYCPAGKDNDAFSDCIAFCNLHGDALLTEKQRDVLMEKSSVNVVLVPTLQKDDKSRSMISDLFKSEKPLICLVDDSCDAVEIKKGKYKMGLKDKNLSDVSEQLRRVIGEVLSSRDPSSSKPTFQLETMADVSGIRVDESDPVCQRGKSAAMEVVSLLEGMEVSEIKDRFLPCQGHLWHEWCRTNKELYHLKGNVEEERSKKLTKLDQIRKTQLDASCSELMKLFTKSLLSLSSTEKEYFLKWIQILVDALSTDDLSSILQSYDETWSQVLALKNNKKDRDKNSDKLSRKQTELEDLSKKLQSATFGLEHIFREMGQIYEAHKTMKSKSSQTGWSKYPELAADLLISGHPMELMDGDAGHVPLIWISSLLDEVIKKLDDQRVFVLSVLGVQGSGKSTMLNAMFGLQFAVSAGRCTKGVFMQLVKVSEEIKKDFRFDYILVVDTEGLLAGNATLHHDNELATFVVGLGNMTIINIFGENPADMQDILQFIVQAFMRMKKVQLSPSCVFVHQNVTDIAAAEKNMDGKRRLQEKLDQMAQLAAKEETSNAECFNDVIAFDVQKDVKYAAHLWEGSPPMAPPNPGYSESIQELKNIILSKASTSAGITFSQLKTKIKDLWDALLNENFVFSFKNTLEIAVYRKLEVQYGNWTWALRSNMLTIEDQLYTRIENGKLDKIEQNYLLKETSKTYEDIKKSMEALFEDDENKEILVQWKGRFESKIKKFHEEQARGVKRKLEVVIEQKNACKKMDEKKTEFENKLLQKSKELAHQLKDKVHDEEELKKQFGSVWDGWVHELTAGARPVEDINFEDEQLIVLLELGIECVHVEESKKNGRYKDMSKSGDYSDYIIMTKTQLVVNFLRKRLSCEKQEQIRELIINVEKESLDEIKSKPVATRGYGSSYLQAVAKNVKDKVTTFQSKFKYTLKNEFTVDLLLHVFDRMESWLLASQKTFKENNDAFTYLNSKKMQNYSIFRSFCKGNSSTVVLGELICEKLRASAADAVYNRTAVGLAGEMRYNFEAFKENRQNLEKHLLKSLAENEDFDSFLNYIRDPRAQAEAFIKEEVDKYIFKHHKDKAVNILKKNVDDINNIVRQALSDATQKVQTQEGDTEMWLSEFTGCLSDVLKFETISSQNFSDINDFKFLQEEVKKGLKPVVEEMKKLSLDKIKESRKKPDEIFIDQLLSGCCWVKCPFCAAVCTNTIEDHSPDEHSVPFHRPSGINGWHYKDTVEMSINFCTTDVASDGSFYSHDRQEFIPFKDYRLGGPKYANWRITADDSKLPYWKWFVCRFQKKLEDHYQKKFQDRGEIPAEWRSITKDEAIESLDEMCE